MCAVFALNAHLHDLHSCMLKKMKTKKLLEGRSPSLALGGGRDARCTTFFYILFSFEKKYVSIGSAYMTTGRANALRVRKTHTRKEFLQKNFRFFQTPRRKLRACYRSRKMTLVRKPTKLRGALFAFAYLSK